MLKGKRKIASSTQYSKKLEPSASNVNVSQKEVQKYFARRPSMRILPLCMLQCIIILQCVYICTGGSYSYLSMHVDPRGMSTRDAGRISVWKNICIRASFMYQDKIVFNVASACN